MLEVKNLFVQYQDAKIPAIQDISFNIEKGDRIAILGPSGCGKSTTLNVIAGLLAEKEAEIRGGLKWDENLQKPVIRMVFQEATLLPWRTVDKNISFGLEIQKFNRQEISNKVKEILRIVGLEESAKNYPHQLSVGMQQRVNFARALVCEPDLLLLDEPFSALDVETKKNIQVEFARILKEKNITSIFVTHDIKEAVAMSDKIIILSKSPSIVSKIIDNRQGENFFEEKLEYDEYDYD